MGAAKTELDRKTQPGRPGTHGLATRIQELSLKSKCGHENDIAVPRWSPVCANGSPWIEFCIHRAANRETSAVSGLGS